METKVMESMDGVTVYPVVSLIVFILFFVAIIIWMIRADKEYLKKMSSLPLDDSNLENNIN
jgi:glucan phosphoethanolaminetransferase (alkaline phosphatase superfamily)